MTNAKNNTFTSLVSAVEQRSESTSFRTSQEFLARAAQQLKVWNDDLDKRRRKHFTEFGRQVVHLVYIQSLRCGDLDGPHMEMLKEQMKFMNIKELAKLELKLSLTPERLAVRYLQWVFASLGTNEANPLRGWLRDLEAEIDERYLLYSPKTVYVGAERKFYCLTWLFGAALIGWIDAYCSMLTFAGFARARALVHGRIHVDLLDRLTEHRNVLLVCEATGKIIEDEYLHASVLPDDWRAQLDPSELPFADLAPKVHRRRKESNLPITSEQCLAQAHSRVEILMQTARAKANLADCHQLLFDLPQARLRLTNVLGYWKELMSLADKP